MAPRKQSSEIRQALKLLEAMSERKRAAVLQLIRVMAEEEEDAEFNALLEAHPEWAEEDRAASEAFLRGDRTGLVSSEEVLAEMCARNRRTGAAHVPGLV